jgi:hypothetical protein
MQEKNGKKEGANPPAANDLYSRDTWTFSGYGSPESALVSAIWAMKEGNPTIYLESLSAEEQERMAKTWLNKSEAEIAAKHKKDVSAITAFRILEKQTISENEVQFRVEIKGANRTETVALKRAGNDWKFGGFLRNSQ